MLLLGGLAALTGATTGYSHPAPAEYGSLQRLEGARSSGAVAISADGRVAAVGGNASVLDIRGAVYVYVRSQSRWKLAQKVMPGGRPQGFGHSVALSADGRVAVVGAWSAMPDHDRPAVYVLVRSGSRWDVVQTFPAEGEDDGFGESVAVSGDGGTIAVGDSREPPDEAGVTHVFTRSGSTWVETTRLVGRTLDPTFKDFAFGGTVALTRDGGTLLVESLDGSEIFVRGGKTWQRATLIPAKRVHLSAGAISPDGTVAVLTDDDPGLDVEGPGLAYIFVRTGSRWKKVLTIVEPGSPRAWNEFGEGLAVSRRADTLLIGAPLTHLDEEGTNRGLVYVFTRVGARSWRRTQTLRPRMSTDPRRWVSQFGMALSVTPDARRLVVGALDPAFAYGR